MTKDCYTEAVIRNNKRLYLIALSFTKNHYDAEDILQNIFLKLWKYEKAFENNEHIDKWLTRVCVNESKNHLKLSFRKNNFLEDEKELYTFDSIRDVDVFNAVMSLPKKERITVHMFYYEDMSVKDISCLLNVKESAVKTRLNRARNKLREILGDEWIYE